MSIFQAQLIRKKLQNMQKFSIEAWGLVLIYYGNSYLKYKNKSNLEWLRIPWRFTYLVNIVP